MKKILSLLLIGFSLFAFADNAPIAKSVSASATGNKKIQASTANAQNNLQKLDNANLSVIVKITPCVVDSPCAAVRDTTQQIMNIINANNTSPDVINKITSITVPKFDFRLMTKYALGNNWKLATTKQQNELVDLFQSLLIYTYSSAVTKFKNAKITLISESTKNIGSDKNANKILASVASQVLLNNSNNSQPVKVEYDLVHYNNKPWMAYDIKIEDASLVTTYRNQFNDVVASRKIDGLISDLKLKIATFAKAN